MMKLDKTRITRTIGSKYGDKKELHNFYNFVCGNSFDIPGSKNWSNKEKNWSYSTIPLDANNKVRVGYGYANKFIRGSFQFNPGQLSPGGYAALKNIVDSLVVGGMEAFIKTSRVSNVEFAEDIDGIQFDDYIFVDTRLRAFKDDYESLGTMYIGSPASHRQVKAYDKRKQLQKKEGIILPDSRLRIEATIDRPLCTVAGLPLLSNPFASLLVVEKQQLLAHMSNTSIAEFVRTMGAGMSAQEAYIHSFNRPKLQKALRALQPSWYDPAAIWNKAANAVEWAQQF